MFRRWMMLAYSASILACGDAGRGADESAAGGGGVGVGQGGAQDFGEFRAILDQGGIPGPETLDDVGFFNEHVFELPPPSCGDDVCVHAELAVMGNMISGANCTMIMIGLNTPLDPDAFERPPLNLAIAIDTSGSMEGRPIEYVREGLHRMIDDLGPDDRVSLIGFDTEAELLVDHGLGTDVALTDAIDALGASGSTNIYAGLRLAYEAVERHRGPDRQNRVILLSDGESNVGVTSNDRIVNLASTYAERGIGTTTIGMGEAFNPALMRTLSEVGAGAFYFLENPVAVHEVFEEEVRAFLVPLAEDVTIELGVSSADYRLRAIHGTNRADVDSTLGFVDIPSLQIAHRTDDAPTSGRRGGGGVMLAELTPRSSASSEVGEVASITLQYRVPGTEETVEQTVEIVSPVAPGALPEQGVFDSPTAEKAFVTLNIYAGFAMASERALWGDDWGAFTVLEALRESVDTWLADRDDEDIEDDLVYIDKFLDNLRSRGAGEPPAELPPPEPWPED